MAMTSLSPSLLNRHRWRDLVRILAPRQMRREPPARTVNRLGPCPWLQNVRLPKAGAWIATKGGGVPQLATRGRFAFGQRACTLSNKAERRCLQLWELRSATEPSFRFRAGILRFQSET